MKKHLPGLALLTLCLIILSFTSNAQSSQDSIRSQVETVDGNEYIGIILEQNAQTVRIKTDKLGEISIPRVEVKRITQLTSVKTKQGTYWLDNPQATRYFWSPNAYSLKAGEGYYQNVWILANQAVYGFTNHLSGGIGMVPLFLFDGAPTPVWVTAKYSVPVVENKFNLGVGALAGTVIGVNNDDVFGDEDGNSTNNTFGILYGIATLGSKDKNLNIGLGWAFAEGEIAKNPTLNISGMIRIGPKGYLMTENYIVGTPEETVVITMLGGRSIIRRVGLDYGLVLPFFEDMDTFIAIPWLGISIPFGQKGTLVK